MLQTLVGDTWTHKTIVHAVKLPPPGDSFLYLKDPNNPDPPTLTLNEQIVTNKGGGTYDILAGTPVNLTGWTGTVVRGTGTSLQATVGLYTPMATRIYFSPDFSVPLDNTSVIRFTSYHSYKDVMLMGLPANHNILGVKISTISSFVFDTAGYSMWVYLGNSNVFTTPTNYGDALVNNLSKTYGMANLTIPSGSGDSYEYGSFRWFTFSAPGGPTYSRNPLPGNPTIGSYCLPQRLDAHDVVARFCILNDTTTTPAHPVLLDPVTDNMAMSNATAGDVEITIQYTAL